MYGTASRCREIDRTKCNRPSDEHWPKQVAQALVVLIGLEAAMPYYEDMPCSQDEAEIVMRDDLDREIMRQLEDPVAASRCARGRSA